MSRIRLVQGDTRPDIVVALVNKSTWEPVDLSSPGTSIVMRFRAANSTTVLQTIAGTKLTGQVLSDGRLDTSVTTAGAGGRAKFVWPAGALDVDPGYYEGEISVNFSDGSVQTVYDLVKFYVREDA